MRRWLAERRRPWLLPRRYPISISDVVYRSVGNSVLQARVYRPGSVPAFAALLDVHGGDWSGGDRFQQQILSRSLAANGVLVAAIDYRLAPAHVYPAAVEDVCAAALWLRLQTVELGAAADAAVGALGSSAGGHLALLTALQLTGSLAFVVADAPVTDVPAYLARYGGPHPFWPSPELTLSGSPLSLLERGSSQPQSPLLITHGDQDDAVPLSMSRRFVEAYRAAGGEAHLSVFEGLGHAFVLSQPRRRESRLLAERVLAFITTHAHPS
jgi:acetyl esterase/lipase